MKKAWLLGSAALAVVAAAAALRVSDKIAWPQAFAALGLGKAADGKPDVTLEFVAREVVQPSHVALARMVQFSGPLVAPNTVLLRSKAAGTLVALGVAEGSRVRAGQVVGSIDGTEIASRQAERRAMLESARAQLAQAERTQATNQRLADQQFISPTALDNSRAALQTAKAQFDAAQASLDTLRVAQRDTVLVAPIDGIVAKRFALPGEKLSIEQQVLSIVDLKRLELAGSVSTHEVSLLAPGLPVQVQVEGIDAAVAGTLARIAPAAEAGTRSIGVIVAIDNARESLRAGQYALASVMLADGVPRLTLPITAIGSSGGQEHVWVIDDGVLARRAVTTGRRDEREGLVEVLQGLLPNAQVLAARFDGLREGTKAVLVARRSAEVATSAASAPGTSR
jgi:membrane fusion protein, multidrug efflux system